MDQLQGRPMEDLKVIVKYLLAVAKDSQPQAFKAYLMGGILSNVVANLPEDYFEQMVQAKRCGRQGCDCHLLAEEARNLLTSLREDHQRHVGMLDPD